MTRALCRCGAGCALLLLGESRQADRVSPASQGLALLLLKLCAQWGWW